MKAIVCNKPGMLLLEIQPSPHLSPDRALLRITRLGVYGTDLHSYTRILGHEMQRR